MTSSLPQVDTAGLIQEDHRSSLRKNAEKNVLSGSTGLLLLECHRQKIMGGVLGLSRLAPPYAVFASQEKYQMKDIYKQAIEKRKANCLKTADISRSES